MCDVGLIAGMCCRFVYVAAERKLLLNVARRVLCARYAALAVSLLGHSSPICTMYIQYHEHNNAV